MMLASSNENMNTAVSVSETIGENIPTTSNVAPEAININNVEEIIEINENQPRVQQRKRRSKEKSVQKKRLIEMHKDGLLQFKPKNEIFSGRISSNAWDQFHLILDANSNQTINDYVVCIKCYDFVEYNGSTTSNLINHKCNANRFKSINHQCEERARQFNPNHIQKTRDALVKFVTLDIRPFYAIEGEGLIDLLVVMAEFGNLYSSLTRAELRKLIPSRRTIKRDTEAVAEEMKNEIALRFREALEYPGGFSCTVDIWTENHTHISYLGITAHLSLIKNNKISRSQYVFHVDSINENHLTGPIIHTKVEKVFQEFGVNREEIESKITFVSDRGKNIVNALSTCPRINCYAHLLNNLVHSMLETKTADEIINNCSSLVRYINKSSLKNDRQLTKSLKQYCETRWNTCQVMIESVYENYDSVYNVLCEKERDSSSSTHLTQKITCLQKDELAAMNGFLKPFTNMTKQIEGDLKPTIHMVWPIYRKIYAYLQPIADEIPLIAEMRNLGLKYLLKNQDAFEPTMQHKVAVFLHPMLKKLSFTSSLIVNEIHNFVQETLEALDVNVNNGPAANDALNVPNNNDSIFDEFLNDINTQITPTRCSELERYIECTIEPAHDINQFDLDKWWSQHREVFPNLMKIYMKIYNVTSTSAPIERAFSSTGRIVEDRRSCLLPSSVNMIVVARNKYIAERENRKQ